MLILSARTAGSASRTSYVSTKRAIVDAQNASSAARNDRRLCTSLRRATGPAAFSRPDDDGFVLPPDCRLRTSRSRLVIRWRCTWIRLCDVSIHSRLSTSSSRPVLVAAAVAPDERSLKRTFR